MIKDFDTIMPANIEQFSSYIKELRNEITQNGGNDEDDAIILEVIDVIQEEMAKRKTANSKKKDVKSDVKLFAYLNLFSSIMDGSFEEDFDEDSFSEEFNTEDFEDEDDEEEEDK